MRAATTTLFVLLTSGICLGHQPACGLTSMTETAKPLYPPIAKAAHIEGNIIMLVTFKLNGAVEKIDVVSGPEMLKAAARIYVQGWHANEYTGPRTCPIIVNFHILHEGDTTTPTFIRQDLQHVTLNSIPLVLYTTNY